MVPRALLVAFVAALGLAGAAAPSQSSTAGMSLRLSSVNPRYFADSSGRAVYLTGSHVWWNLVGDRTWRVDCRYGAAKPFDYGDYLNRLVRYHHNFIRLWTIELTTWRECGDLVRVAPQPWRRTGPGKAFDGLPKFDLKRFDPVYFRRLRARVATARAKGIYVAVMLFEGWGEQFQPQPWRSRAHPFHRLNNVNGLSPDRSRDGQLFEIYTMRSPRARRIQEAYVRKVIDTVGRFDNVLYEIANESGKFSIPWQYRMIDVVKRHQARRGFKRPVGITFIHGDWDGDALFRSKADWVAPKDPRHLTDPPTANARKVIFSDTDHHGLGYGNPTFPWKTFMRGYNPILMDELTPAEWIEEIRYAMGNTRRYAERISLARMAPRGDLCSTGYCLVWPGREYLVYQSTGGAFTVNLAAGQGRTFAVEWMHPVTGRITPAETVQGGASRTLRPPFAGPAVAYLVARP